MMKQTKNLKTTQDLHQSFGDTTRVRSIGQSGQIVVEYILLLAVAVTIAALITKTMIGTDPNKPGFVLTAWRSIVREIGADHADDIDRGN
jgi:hypothetical protein